MIEIYLQTSITLRSCIRMVDNRHTLLCDFYHVSSLDSVACMSCGTVNNLYLLEDKFGDTVICDHCYNTKTLQELNFKEDFYKEKNK